MPHMYWMMKDVAGVRFGGEVEKGSYAWEKKGTVTYPGIVDSGTSLILIPDEVYHDYMRRLW